MPAQEYIAKLRADCKRASWSLSEARSETICSSRTIKEMTAWKTPWPILRELLQNTIDHLGLYDASTGGTNPCLTLEQPSAGVWSFQKTAKHARRNARGARM